MTVTSKNNPPNSDRVKKEFEELRNKQRTLTSREQSVGYLDKAVYGIVGAAFIGLGFGYKNAVDNISDRLSLAEDGDGLSYNKLESEDEIKFNSPETEEKVTEARQAIVAIAERAEEESILNISEDELNTLVDVDEEIWGSVGVSQDRIIQLLGFDSQNLTEEQKNVAISITSDIQKAEQETEDMNEDLETINILIALSSFALGLLSITDIGVGMINYQNQVNTEKIISKIQEVEHSGSQGGNDGEESLNKEMKNATKDVKKWTGREKTLHAVSGVASIASGIALLQDMDRVLWWVFTQYQ